MVRMHLLCSVNLNGFYAAINRLHKGCLQLVNNDNVLL